MPQDPLVLQLHGSTTVPWGTTVDILHGNKGNDRLKTREQFPESDSLDTVYGGKGTDTCRVNDGDEYFGCEVVYVDGVLQP
jgi:hypothetical protein